MGPGESFRTKTISGVSLQKNKLVGTILNIYNPENHTNSGYQITRNQQQNQNSGNEFGQYMEYVDSPPDSKEAWPADYLKSKFPWATFSAPIF